MESKDDVGKNVSLSDFYKCSAREINMVFPNTMYFYVYYIKESLFKQNKIPIFINLAVGC